MRCSFWIVPVHYALSRLMRASGASPGRSTAGTVKAKQRKGQTTDAERQLRFHSTFVFSILKPDWKVRNPGMFVKPVTPFLMA